jgi:hypothetical protein
MGKTEREKFLDIPVVLLISVAGSGIPMRVLILMRTGSLTWILLRFQTPTRIEIHLTFNRSFCGSITIALSISEGLIRIRIVWDTDPGGSESSTLF